MKYLFVIAMKKEANKIIENYNLKEVKDNYFVNGDIELVITDISRNGITSSLVNLMQEYNLNYKNYIMINVGMVGSNNLKIGSVVTVNESLGYHFDLTPFGDPLYHALNSPFKMDIIDDTKQIKCYTSDGFVTSTNIEEDAIFDMELNAITNFPFNKYYSIKIVSDSLNNKEYDDFNFDEKLNEVYQIVQKIRN